MMLSRAKSQIFVHIFKKLPGQRTQNEDVSGKTRTYGNSKQCFCFLKRETELSWQGWGVDSKIFVWAMCLAPVLEVACSCLASLSCWQGHAMPAPVACGPDSAEARPGLQLPGCSGRPGAIS